MQQGQLEAPAEGAIELAGADGHLRRRGAALDLDLHAGEGPVVESPATQRPGQAASSACGEEQWQLEVVVLHLQGRTQVREEGRSRQRRRLEGQRRRDCCVVRLPDAERGGIQGGAGGGASGEAGHELTAGDQFVASVGGATAVAAAVGAGVAVGGGIGRKQRQR